MSKRLILVLAFAFVAAVTFTAAYAEVQNVKVSGDITVHGIARNNLDLAKATGSTNGQVDSALYDDTESSLAEIAKLRVDADLTDNVSVVTRLISERNMNGNDSVAGRRNTNVGLTTATASQNVIALHLAYVTLKEFLYSPLTLSVGRQALRFGNAFIVGDPDTNGVSVGNLSAGDLSQFKAFDAIRGTLDYNPLTLDLVYAKIGEGRADLNDDTTLTGVNAKYALDKETTIEGFFFSKARGAGNAAVTNVDSGNATSFTNTAANNFPKDKTDKVHTVGARVVNKTINNLTLDVQGAFQFGTYNPKFDPNAHFGGLTRKAGTANRRAWAAEFVAVYNLKDIAAISKYSPSIMGAFVYLSGESRDKVGDKDYRGWDPMYEDQTFGHLINAIMGFSNAKIGGLSLSAKPVDDVTAKLDYVGGWLNKKFTLGRLANLSGASGARTFAMGSGAFLGQEIDLTLTYDYTEDVQFSLLGGIFLPSKNVNVTRTNTGAPRPDRAAATELIGSMKVAF